MYPHIKTRLLSRINNGPTPLMNKDIVSKYSHHVNTFSDKTSDLALNKQSHATFAKQVCEEAYTIAQKLYKTTLSLLLAVGDTIYQTKNNLCCKSTESLGKMVGVCKRQARRIRKTLIDLGLIVMRENDRTYHKTPITELTRLGECVYFLVSKSVEKQRKQVKKKKNVLQVIFSPSSTTVEKEENYENKSVISNIVQKLNISELNARRIVRKWGLHLVCKGLDAIPERKDMSFTRNVAGYFVGILKNLRIGGGRYTIARPLTTGVMGMRRAITYGQPRAVPKLSDEQKKVHVECWHKARTEIAQTNSYIDSMSDKPEPTELGRESFAFMKSLLA